MQKFCVTRILQGGREYFVANYPANRKPWSRKAAGRAQKKFNRRELAEVFLEEVRCEWIRRGKVELGLDAALHYDVMRAVKILSDVSNATLEKAALIFRLCRSARELPGKRYEVPLSRSVDLSPRFFLLVNNEAQKRGISLREAVEGMLGGWVEWEAERQVKERARAESEELAELRERNEKSSQKLGQIEKEDRLLALMGKQSQAFELGRNSVLLRRAEYQRRWRERKKEREKRQREVTTCGNGT